MRRCVEDSTGCRHPSTCGVAACYVLERASVDHDLAGRCSGRTRPKRRQIKAVVVLFASSRAGKGWNRVFSEIGRLQRNETECTLPARRTGQLLMLPNHSALHLSGTMWPVEFASCAEPHTCRCLSTNRKLHLKLQIITVSHESW